MGGDSSATHLLPFFAAREVWGIGYDLFRFSCFALRRSLALLMGQMGQMGLAATAAVTVMTTQTVVRASSVSSPNLRLRM